MINTNISTTPDDQTSGAPPILYGADEIAAFLFPAEPPQKRRRRIYHLTSEIPEAERLPTFKLGNITCARPATLLAHIAEREGRRTPDGEAA